MTPEIIITLSKVLTMSILSEPDLIVNANGSVYHLCIKPEEMADTIIVVGDPQGVKEISNHFQKVEFSRSNREFISITGYYKGKRVTVLSMGIGTSNCDIVMHELDALANFNLKTREQLSNFKSLTIIRIGISGSIQPDIPLNSFGLSTHAIGLDNIMHFYQGTGGIMDMELTRAFSVHAVWPINLSLPYFIKGSEKLISKFKQYSVTGITATAPGFYGPQGRFLSLDLIDPALISKLQSFQYEGNRIINIDMETSTLYGLGALMGHEMVTISALIANRATGEYNDNYKHTFNCLVEQVLEKIVD